MVYVFSLKRTNHKSVPPEIEYWMDRLIDEPYVLLPSFRISTQLGKYMSELRDNGILHLSSDLKTHEPIACLKINNYNNPNFIVKRKNRTIQYVFKDTLIPRIKIPNIF